MVSCRSRWPQTEEQIGEALIPWLTAEGWDVFQEVQMFGKVADIVATRCGRSWIIELKRAFSMQLIQQAEEWTGYAHFVSVAVPTHVGPLGRRVCEWLGIGVLWVDLTCVVVKGPARLRRRLIRNIADNLVDEHRTFAKAGNSRGERFTPFAQTCQEIARRVEESPGLTMKELMDGLRHHYANDQSARTAIPKWAAGGYIRGVKLERDGRRLRFYPSKVQA